MIPLLSTYFIREHVGMLKLSDTYDILDPESGDQIGVAKERPSGFMHVLRFILNKAMLPTRVDIHAGPDPKNDPIAFSILKRFTLFRSKVDVVDGEGNSLGWFKSKAFSIGGAFRVFDENGEEVALVKGDWKGWNFKFLVGDQQIGSVTKKWTGLGKELFTSADNYVVSIEGESIESKTILLLAAGLAVDIVYKEKS